MRRDDPSPSSVIAGVFNEQTLPTAPPKIRKQNGSVKIGLVPKTMFIKWMRDGLADTAAPSLKQIQKDVKDLRAKILYHFSKAGKFRAKTDARSSVIN